MSSAVGIFILLVGLAFNVLANVLAIRFRGIDPQWLLSWLYPRIKWLFSRWSAMLSVLFCWEGRGINFSERLYSSRLA